MQEEASARARQSRDEPASTLVLLGDAEFDLRASTKRVVFRDWSRNGAAETIAISLEPRDAAQDTASVHLPLVITVPFTARFQLVGPTALASPFIPLLKPHCALEYIVTFVCPRAAESDFVWDNFQDQIVIQTRLSKLVVQLQALKGPDDAEPASFFPQSLPSVKAPSLKLFEYIETAHRRDTSSQTTRRLDAVSESFNGSKNKGKSILEPIHGRSTTASSSASKRIVSDTQVPPQDSHHSLTTDVSTQAEAKAIILKLRARNSTRSGAITAALPAHSDEYSLVHTKPDESCPESRLDATTRAELDAFHVLVVGAKDGVMREQAAAKSELKFYRQFLPQAPTTRSSGEMTPRELQSSSGSNAPSLQPLAPRSAVAVCPAMSTATAPLQLAKPLQGSKAAGKLPTLAVVSPTSLAPAAEAPLRDDECESNQEMSPVRKSVTPTAKQPASTTARQSILSAKSNSSSKPATRASKSKGPEPAHSSRSSASNNAAIPSQCASSRAARDLAHQSKPATLRSEPLATGVKGQAKPKPQQAPKSRGPEAALSDFDDPDPDVDDAPVLPDDLAGMRTAALSGDNDDDEY